MRKTSTDKQAEIRIPSLFPPIFFFCGSSGAVSSLIYRSPVTRVNIVVEIRERYIWISSRIRPVIGRGGVKRRDAERRDVSSTRR